MLRTIYELITGRGYPKVSCYLRLRALKETFISFCIIMFHYHCTFADNYLFLDRVPDALGNG